MPDFYGGMPANAITPLPSSKNISSTSNTTPIVVTTSTAHGIQTGDYVYVTGATDANANGIFPAGTVTSDTVVLVGTTTGGGGGAAGTILDLGWGEEYAIPVDLTDDMDAASVNVALEALGDRTAALLYMIRYANQYKSGGSSVWGTTHVNSGTFLWSGDAFLLGSGRHQWRRARVSLTDANQTINVTQADRFFAGNSTALRTVTLAHSGGNAPYSNETIEVVFRGTVAGGTGSRWTFAREDATTIATFAVSGSVGATDVCMYAEFEYITGTGWRLGAHSGAAYDGGAEYGVIPGASA
jgi:hypothetical protein